MEHQFKPWQPVIVRNGEDCPWKADFFSHKKMAAGGSVFFCCVSGSSWNYCLPAKGNRHLIGTTDSPTPPKPEFKFGDKVEVLDAFASPIEWEKAIFLDSCTITDENAGTKCETIKYCVIFADGRYDVFYRNEIRHADW